MKLWHEFKERSLERNRLYLKAVHDANAFIAMLDSGSCIYVGYDSNPKMLFKQKAELALCLEQYYKACDDSNILDMLFDKHDVPVQNNHLKLLKRQIWRLESEYDLN